MSQSRYANHSSMPASSPPASESGVRTRHHICVSGRVGAPNLTLNTTAATVQGKASAARRFLADAYPSPAGNIAHEEQEIVLLSNDEREFKVKVGTIMMSETVQALTSFPTGEEDPESWNAPDSAIPLPPVEGAVLEKVPNCSYRG